MGRDFALGLRYRSGSHGHPLPGRRGPTVVTALHRPRSRRFACYALVLAATIVGCHADDPGTTTVEFWAFGSEGEHVRPLLDDFERAHPAIRVRLQQIPWSAAHEKLLTAYVGGVMPDIFQLGTTWIAELTAIGALAPLDRRISGAEPIDTSDFFTAALAAGRLDSVTYALPWYVDTRVLYFRTDRLRTAGVRTVPSDWDAWIDALTRVRRAAAPDGYGVLLPLGEWETIVSLAWQHGAQILRDEGRYGDFRAPAFRAALEDYLHLFRGGLAVPPESPGLDIHADFARGRFAFFVSGPWTGGVLGRRLPRALQREWSTAPLPGGNGPGLSVSGGSSLAIHARSAQPDAAWALLRYLVSRESQQRFHLLTGDLPARRSAWSESLRTEPPTRAFWEQLPHARAAPAIAEWERVAQAIVRHTESVVRGLATIDAAVTQLDAEVDAILAKRRWMLERDTGGAAGREH